MSARGLAALSPHLTMGALAMLAGGPILLAAMLLTPAAVLPAISLTALALGGIAAGTAWWLKARRHAATVTLWDVAGAFVLIGCAAAMMTETENLLQVFGHTDSKN